MTKDELASILNDSVSFIEPLGGGCIAKTQKVTTQKGQLFVLKQGLKGDVFLKEARGLKELKKADKIRVPEVVFASHNCLLLEYISNGHKTAGFFPRFGSELAGLHQVTSDSFGFFDDNYIGSTPQINVAEGKEKVSWPDFYFNKRLLYQFQLAEKNGYVDEKFRRLFANIEKRLPDILAGSDEPPALIHGDLWGGNYMVDTHGQPVLIDPAVYYGHREAELAMTRLFGGFGHEFYEGYHQAYPLKDGHEYREGVYALYHVLNHLNIFGAGYRSQVASILESYS